MSIFRVNDRTRRDADRYDFSDMAQTDSCLNYGHPELEIVRTALGPMMMSFHPSDVEDVDELVEPQLALIYGEGFKFRHVRPDGEIDYSRVYAIDGSYVHVSASNLRPVSISVQLGGDSWSRRFPVLAERSSFGLGRVKPVITSPRHPLSKPFVPAKTELEWKGASLSLQEKSVLTLDADLGSTQIVYLIPSYGRV